jgi:AcrR family transcriptional regulator
VELKERILHKAEQLFFRFGVKSVTMDDIARELGVSKKTIYQHFPDKDEMVYQTVLLEMEKDQCEFETLRAGNYNAIERIMYGTEMMRLQFADMNPSLIYDIQKYHPRAWQVFQDHKHDFILNGIREELRQGVTEGLFRADLDVEVLARLRLEQFELGFNHQVYPAGQFTLVQVQLAFADHFIRGIVTEKGLALYDAYQRTQQTNSSFPKPLYS